MVWNNVYTFIPPKRSGRRICKELAATKEKEIPMKENKILDSDLESIKGEPLNLAVLAISLIGMGGLIGATTNLINGNVSEEYFRKIMGWKFEGIWKAAILQGIVEGLIYGLIFSFVFTIGFATITKMKADCNFAKKQLKKIVFLIYGCWIIGGVIAIILAFVFPEEYDRMIYGVPCGTIPRIGYSWVGGSIWGGMIGGIISAIYGLVITKIEWKII